MRDLERHGVEASRVEPLADDGQARMPWPLGLALVQSSQRGMMSLWLASPPEMAGDLPGPTSCSENRRTFCLVWSWGWPIAPSPSCLHCHCPVTSFRFRKRVSPFPPCQKCQRKG